MNRKKDIIKLSEGIAMPIPDISKDKSLFHEFATNLDLVPYATIDRHTAHKYVSVLETLYHTSESLRGAISTLIKFSFGNLAKVQYRAYYGVQEREIEPTEANAVYKTLEGLGIGLSDIMNANNELYRQYCVCGSSVMILRGIRVGSEIRVNLFVPKMGTFIYVKQEGYNRYIVYSDKLDQLGGLHDDDFEVIPLYGNLGIDFSGEFSVAFELKNTPYEIYGRPIYSVQSAISESIRNTVLSTINGKQFSAQHIFSLEMPDFYDDPTDNGKTAQQKMYEYKNELLSHLEAVGDKSSSVAIMWRGIGLVPPNKYDLGINRDAAFYEYCDKRDERSLYSAFGLDADIFKGGIKSGINSNIVVDKLIQAGEITISDAQDTMVSFWDKVFVFLGELIGNAELGNYSMLFENKTKNIVKMVRMTSQTNTTTQPTQDSEDDNDQNDINNDTNTT